MSDESIEQTKKEKRELVALSQKASEKINKWIEQINTKKSVNLSRKTFLSWYIEIAPENLPNADVNAAIETFYDTEAHLRQLLRDVRKAKASGLSDGGIDLVLKPKKQEAKKELSEAPQSEEI